MSTPTRRALVAILANPPLTDGRRTLRRTELAAELLGFSHVAVVNLFALPSHATGEIATLGVQEAGWLTARDQLGPGLRAADGVLLAYGATAPTGPARAHFRNQIEWVHERIAAQELPVWHVGDGPRHPSRWQRWTSRAHPGMPFREALERSLSLVWPASVVAPD